MEEESKIIQVILVPNLVSVYEDEKSRTPNKEIVDNLPCFLVVRENGLCFIHQLTHEGYLDFSPVSDVGNFKEIRLENKEVMCENGKE